MTLFRKLMIPIIKPLQGFDKLFVDDKMLKHSVFIQLSICIVASVTTYLAYLHGFGAALMEPWLRIPAESYYKYSAFFTAPVSFGTAVIASGFMRLMAIAFGGKGSFENDFSVYVISMSLPTYLAVLIPDFIFKTFFTDMSLKPGGVYEFLPYWLETIRINVFAIIWPVVMMIIGLKKAEQISYLKATIILIIGFIPTWFLIMTYIR